MVESSSAACIEQFDEEYSSEDVEDYIVLELPEKAPIDGVERVDITHRDE